MKKSILIVFAAFGINAAIAQTTDTAGNYNRSQATRTQTVTSTGSQTVTPRTHDNHKSSANGTYNGSNTNNNSTNGSTTKNTNGTKRSSTTKSTSTYTTTGPSK